MARNLNTYNDNAVGRNFGPAVFSLLGKAPSNNPPIIFDLSAILSEADADTGKVRFEPSLALT